MQKGLTRAIAACAIASGSIAVVHTTVAHAVPPPTNCPHGSNFDVSPNSTSRGTTNGKSTSSVHFSSDSLGNCVNRIGTGNSANFTNDSDENSLIFIGNGNAVNFNDSDGNTVTFKGNGNAANLVSSDGNTMNFNGNGNALFAKGAFDDVVTIGGKGNSVSLFASFVDLLVTGNGDSIVVQSSASGGPLSRNPIVITSSGASIVCDATGCH